MRKSGLVLLIIALVLGGLLAFWMLARSEPEPRRPDCIKFDDTVPC